MISTIWAKTHRPIGEFPRYAILFMGSEFVQMPVKISRGRFSGRVVIVPESGKSWTMDPTEMATGLVPESWEEAKWDISFLLMEKGVL